jgi:hypothetical protein
MFNSIVLDVVIGLVFIYLLYSLLVTIIQEMIATVFNFRAKILRRAIVRMLEDNDVLTSRFSSLTNLFKKNADTGSKNSTSIDFYNHPLIKFLGENKRHHVPAYIDKETFSKVLTDLLRGDHVKPGDDVKILIQSALDNGKISWGNSRIDDQTLSYLKSIWADAQGDVAKFRVYLEKWFDETMERATGWYKRHTQFILFFTGLAIAILFNVNTIEIVRKLEKDPKLREQIIQQADGFAKAHPDLDKMILMQKDKFGKIPKGNQVVDTLRNQPSAFQSNQSNLDSLIAYQDLLFRRADSLLKSDIKKSNDLLGLGWQRTEGYSFSWHYYIQSLLGWLITALALSLGAPFWFNLLNRLMKLRNAVSKPSSDEQQKHAIVE